MENKLTGVEHDLKIWPAFFHDVATGKKTWEYRHNDRAYTVGDVLVLHEWEPHQQAYTGRSVERVVTYVLHGGMGLPRDHVIMSLVPAPHPPLTAKDRAEATVLVVGTLLFGLAGALIGWFFR